MTKCVLDTNTLIHYQLFSEIRWTEIIQTDSVQLVICATVLAELDRKKFSEMDLDIRNRCRVVVNALSECRKQDQVRENVTLDFWSTEPRVDWNALGLDPTMPDDRIIASILGTPSDVPIVLVTSDLGLELKANSRNIRTNRLADSLRVQVKLDKKDDELRKLNQKVQSLERRLPRLGLDLMTDKGVCTHAHFTTSVPAMIDEADVTGILEQENQKLKEIASAVHGARLPAFGMIDTDFRTPDAEELKRYRDDSEKYLVSLKSYYEKEAKRLYIDSRFFPIHMQLANTGSAPADDIDIILHFPDGFEMSDKNQYSKPYEKPSRPTPPQSAIEKLQNIGLGLASGIMDRSYNRFPGIALPTGPNVSRASIKRSNSFDVTYHIGRLKHKQTVLLGPLWIYFTKNQEISSFQFDFRISVANHPDEVIGSLNVIFETLAS